ncbi:MAG TPA: XisI protein [Pyrinomonadaceae bacterium]|nr:XisI protein [Pyrinomonadaceae bacterium]
MDKLEKYRKIIEKILREHAVQPYAYDEIERRMMFDREKDSYMLYIVGWGNRRRYHGIVIHLDIINDKIYIQHDGTEEGIATDLECEGVPKSDIVLAFHAPELRKYTEYAVA